MSEENIITFKYDPNNPPKLERTSDWERLRNMTEEEIIANALSDPDNPPATEEELKQFRRVNPGLGKPPMTDSDKKVA